jgi:hypothetical protein
MAAILKANTNYAPGANAYLNIPGSLILAYDSGNIVAVGTSGKPAMRATVGLQAQATQSIQCDSTAGVVGNTILPPTLPSNATGSNKNLVYQVVSPATLTNSSTSTTGNVTTAVFTAANSFVVGNTVKFSGLTNAINLNGLCGVVIASGLSATAFSATVTGQTVATYTSSAETGSATLNYFSATSCLSADSEKE